MVDADQLIRALTSSDEMPRLPLYLNVDRINEAFEQRLGAVKEVLVTRGIAGEVSGGWLGLLGGKLSKKKDVGAKIELTPVLKALLLEFEERENDRLVDLSLSKATGNAFLYFIGDGRIFPPWEVVEADARISLEGEAASDIQQERERYESWIRPDRDDAEPAASPGRTLVWIGSGRQLLAAVASEQWMMDSTLARFAQTPPFGVLGRLQRSDDAIAFLAPFWIWR